MAVFTAIVLNLPDAPKQRVLRLRPSSPAAPPWGFSPPNTRIILETLWPLSSSRSVTLYLYHKGVYGFFFVALEDVATLASRGGLACRVRSGRAGGAATSRVVPGDNR